MEVLLIRHGDPDYQRDTITEIGHREAKMLAISLSAKPLSTIYVSPLGRAKDTMRYTADIMKIDFTTLEWLREVRAPAVDGYAAWELPGTYILSESKLPDLQTWFEDPLFGKSFLPFYQKIANRFDKIMHLSGYKKFGHMYRIHRASSKRIAFFSHKGTILTLLSYLLHWPLPLLFSHCQISPTGVTRLIWKKVDQEWAAPQLQGLNDLSHLNASVAGSKNQLGQIKQ